MERRKARSRHGKKKKKKHKTEEKEREKVFCCSLLELSKEHVKKESGFFTSTVDR